MTGARGQRRRPARNQGKPNLPMYGSPKDEMTYHTWRCYVLGYGTTDIRTNQF